MATLKQLLSDLGPKPPSPDDAPAPGAPEESDVIDQEDLDPQYGHGLGRGAEGFARTNPSANADQDGQLLQPRAQGYVPQAARPVDHVAQVREPAPAGCLADQLAVPDDRCLQVLGEDPHRRSCTVFVIGGAVRIGPAAFDKTQLRGSFPLADGAGYDYDTTAPLWVQADAAGTSVALLVTFDKGCACCG